MTKRTAVTFALITLIIAFVVAAHIKEQQITMFPSDHGNLAGNLHNSGLVFEMDGKVFFPIPPTAIVFIPWIPTKLIKKDSPAWESNI